MEKSKQSRFAEMRQQLEKLNYSESLGSIESLDLIEHMYRDLANTKYMLDQIQAKEARLAGDLSLAQAQLFPLRKENARLARENHDLHVDQIKQNDANRATYDEYNKKIRSTESDKGQLKLVLEGKERQLQEHESHLKRIREHFAAISDPKGSAPSKRAIKLSSQLDAKSVVSGVSRGESLISGKPQQMLPGQWLSIDNNVVETQRQQIESLRADLQRANDENKRLNMSIASREQELSRSTKIMNIVSSNYVDNSESSSSSALMPSNRSEQLLAADVANKRIIDQLNGQVDFLNEQLAAKEQQLIEIGDKLRRFDSVQMELQQRTTLLDQTRKENAQLTTHMRALEQKCLDVQMDLEEAKRNASSSSSGVAAASFSANYSVNFPGESKAEANDDRAVLASLAVMTNERNELAAETIRQQRVIEEFNKKHNASTLNTWKQGVKGAKVQNDALVSDLNKQVEEGKKRVSTLTRSLSQSEDRNKVLLAEKEELGRKLKFHEHTRNQSESQKLSLSLQADLTRVELVRDGLVAELQQDRATLSECQRELGALRQQYAVLLTEKEQLALEADLRGSDFRAVKAAHDDSAAVVSEQRTVVSRLTIELEDARTALALSEGKCGVLRKQVDEARSDAERLRGELDTLARVGVMNRADAAHASIIEQLKVDKQQLVLQVTHLQSELAHLETQRDSLHQVASYLGLQQAEHAGVVQDSLAERHRILSSLREKDARIQDLQLQLDATLSDAERKKEGLLSSDSAYRSLREDFALSKRQLQEQAARINQLTSDLSLGEQRLQSATEEAEGLTHRAKDAERQQLQVESELRHARSDLGELQHQLILLTAEREAVESELLETRRRTEEAQRRGNSSKNDYHNVLQDKKDLQRQLEEQDVLLKNHATTTRSLNKNVEQLTARLRTSEDNERRLEREIDSLNGAIQDRDKRIAELIRNVEALDGERDRLHDLLNDAEDRLEESEKEVRSLKESELTHKSMVTQGGKLQHSLKQELANVTNELGNTRARLNKQQEAFAQLRRQFEESEVVVQTSRRDLEKMTRDNQAMFSDLGETIAERDRLRKTVSEKMHEITVLDQIKRAMEIEKADLLETYRSVLRDKKKLEAELSDVSNQKSKESQGAANLFDEVNELHGVVNALKQNERVWVGDKLALGKQLEMLNEQLLQATARVVQLEDEKRKMINDTNGLMQTNAMLNDRINLVIKRATGATEANKILTTTLSQVEKERDAVRSLIGIERQRAVEMGQLVEEARTQAATKDLELQRMRNQAASSAEVTHANSTTSESYHDASGSHITVTRTTRTTTASSSSAVEHSAGHSHTHSD